MERCYTIFVDHVRWSDVTRYVLIVCCLTSHSKFFIYVETTSPLAANSLQHLVLCSTLKPLRKKGIFIVSRLPWHETDLGFWVPSTAERSHLVGQARGTEELFLPESPRRKWLYIKRSVVSCCIWHITLYTEDLSVWFQNGIKIIFPRPGVVAHPLYTIEVSL